jgi:V/A-type H+-transporting ATPase subunit D
LIAAKNVLALSKQGYDLLDKKRNILVRELMTLIDKAEIIQTDIDSVFTKAYEALQIANITIGISSIDEIGFAIPEEKSISITSHSVMGVEIPNIKYSEEDIKPFYGLVRTNSSLDEAYKNFIQVKKLTMNLAEVENAVYRLAKNIKQTQKRANALKNIIIPKYEKVVYGITNALEEKEREEFTRLKVIKAFNK